MRTTLTLDPDVALMLKRRMERKNLTLKRAINEALRVGLAGGKPKRNVRYKVESHPFRFKPGIDLDKLGQLADELEAEETLKTLSK
jgi:hypothetical protein